MSARASIPKIAGIFKPKPVRRVLFALLFLLAFCHLYGLVLRFVPVPGTALMVQRSMAGQDIQKDWSRIEDISPYLAYAIIGAEDSRFCEHYGIDPKAIDKALEERAQTGRRRGASTITQQTAKNVFLWNGGGWIRKLPETWLALYIDAVWSKHRIMEVYLNVAEWGDGIFGAEAAAQARFSKSAKDLTAREAALLAAVLPSPNKWRVDPPGDYVNRRAQTLEARMKDVKIGGYGSCINIDEGQMKFPAPKPPPKIDSAPEAETIADETEVETENEIPDNRDKAQSSLDDLLDDIEKEIRVDGKDPDNPPDETEVDEATPERL